MCCGHLEVGFTYNAVASRALHEFERIFFYQVQMIFLLKKKLNLPLLTDWIDILYLML